MSEENEDVSAVEEWSDISAIDILILVLIFGFVCWIIWSKYFRKDETKVRTLSLSIPKAGGGIVSRSFLERAQSGGHRVVLFYGSQTGTAESFASRVAKECKGLGLTAFVYDPEDCDDWDQLAQFRDMSHSIGEVLTVFCIATYGVGDPTDNSIEFVDWLKSTDVDLSGLNFAVFGLGNKTYEFYNEIGEFELLAGDLFGVFLGIGLLDCLLGVNIFRSHCRQEAGAFRRQKIVSQRRGRC